MQPLNWNVLNYIKYFLEGARWVRGVIYLGCVWLPVNAARGFGLQRKFKTLCLIGIINEKTVIYFYTVSHIFMQTNCATKSNVLDFHPLWYQSNGHKTFNFCEILFTLKTVSTHLVFKQTKHNLIKKGKEKLTSRAVPPPHGNTIEPLVKNASSSSTSPASIFLSL